MLELRHAVRRLVREPGFTALAAGTLALGIAASTAIFSLADAVVLAPLPYEKPARRVMVWNRWRGFDKTWVNPAEMRAYAERCPSLAALAHWGIDRQNLTGDGEAVRVADVRHNGITGIVKAKFYRPYTQFHRSRGGPTRDMALLVKADGDPLALAGPIREAVRRLDPTVPVSNVRTLASVVNGSIAAPRLASLVLSLFAVVAVVLCAVGVYGVLAMGVAERRQEIGVRMALGAQAAAVSRLVLGEGLAAVGSGLVLGLGAAALMTRFLVGLLHGVQPLDPATHLAVAAALGTVALVAGLLPALRAARTDPAVALRAE